MEQLEKVLWELREEKRKKRIEPEVLTLTSIRNKYGKDPLPELRQLWAMGLVRNCKTLNDIGFFYDGE